MDSKTAVPKLGAERGAELYALPCVGDRLVAALPTVIAQVARETSVASVASRIARAFVLELGARTARVYLFSRTSERSLTLVAAENIDASTRARLRVLDAGDGVPAAVAARSGLLQLMDADDAPTFGGQRDAVGLPGAERVAMGLPLFADSVTLGALSADFDFLVPRQCAALGTLSDSLGALIDRARLRDDLASPPSDAPTRPLKPEARLW
jgi:hypothetical protein